MWTREEHVRGFCRAFLVPGKRERLEGLLLGGRREVGMMELAHSEWVDRRFARRVRAWEVGDAVFGENGLGAGGVVYVMSGAERLDDREMRLDEAIEEVMGIGLGTVVSCVPGRVCLYEGEYGEEDRWVLVRGE